MYTTSAYYISYSLAGLLVFFLYPCFTAMISYWFFGFDNPKVGDMLDWMFCLALSALSGSMWGYTLGTFFSSESTALNVNIVFILLFNSGAGHTSNIGKNVNYFGKLISTISPIRYGTEMLMSRILKGSPAE